MEYINILKACNGIDKKLSNEKSNKKKPKKTKKGILGVPIPSKRDRILFLINVSNHVILCWKGLFIGNAENLFVLNYIYFLKA